MNIYIYIERERVCVCVLTLRFCNTFCGFPWSCFRDSGFRGEPVLVSR